MIRTNAFTYVSRIDGGGSWWKTLGGQSIDDRCRFCRHWSPNKAPIRTSPKDTCNTLYMTEINTLINVYAKSHWLSKYNDLVVKKLKIFQLCYTVTKRIATDNFEFVGKTNRSRYKCTVHLNTFYNERNINSVKRASLYRTFL